MPITLLAAMRKSETPSAFIADWVIPGIREGKLADMDPHEKRGFERHMKKKGEYHSLWFRNANEPQKKCIFGIMHTKYNDAKLQKKMMEKDSFERPKFTLFSPNTKVYLHHDEKKTAIEKLGTFENKHISGEREGSSSIIYKIPHETVAHWKPEITHDTDGRKTATVDISANEFEELEKYGRFFKTSEDYTTSIKFISGIISEDRYSRLVRLEKYRATKIPAAGPLQKHIIMDKLGHPFIEEMEKMAGKIGREIAQNGHQPKQQIAEKYGKELAQKMKVIYGVSGKSVDEKCINIIGMFTAERVRKTAKSIADELRKIREF